MSPSPTCEVKDGASAYVATTNGVDVTPGNTIIIRLASQVDVNSWSIQCVTTDDTSDAATVTASLTIDTVLKTATFTAPAVGKAYRFRSMVNAGVDVNGVAQTSYSTTFCIYTLTGGRRVIAADETTEGDATFGWSKWLNSLIRSPPSAVAYGQSYQFLYYSGGSMMGATGLTYDPTNRITTVTGMYAHNATMVAPRIGSGFLQGPIVNSPLIGGTAVYTGLAMVAAGASGHQRFSEMRGLKTSNASGAAIYAWKIKDEAVTTVVAEIDAVPSGGNGGGSLVRRARIRSDGGVATMGTVENNFTDVDPGPGFTGIAATIGVSGATGFVLVYGTPTGRIDWGAVISRSELNWT